MKKALINGALLFMLFTGCKKAAVIPPQANETISGSSVALEAATPAVSAAAAAAPIVFTSNENYAVYSNGGNYAAYNDAWGTGTNYTQRINCYSTTNWYSTANYVTGSGGVKSYPHSTDQVGTYINSLNNCTSNFDYSAPTNGTCDRSYDIWLGSNDLYEVMLWMGTTGNPNPIAAKYDASGHAIAELTNINVGWHVWDVYRRQNTNGKYVYTFIRKTDLNAGSVNIKSVLIWLRDKGWMGNEKLNRIEFGFEIFSGNGNWTLNSFSTTVN